LLTEIRRSLKTKEVQKSFCGKKEKRHLMQLGANNQARQKATKMVEVSKFKCNWPLSASTKS
jgi:hypothetical protein